MTEFDKEIALQYFDTRLVSFSQVQTVEKMRASQVQVEMERGAFPMPIGEVCGESQWRLGDIIRWREGWA